MAIEVVEGKVCVEVDPVVVSKETKDSQMVMIREAMEDAA